MHAADHGSFADGLGVLAALNTMPDLSSTEEKRSFQFFRQFTAPIFASDYDSGFWTMLVLKLCHTERAVRHAVLAVSSLHESLVEGDFDATHELVDKQIFALQQYNLAISISRDQMNEDAAYEPVVPLLMCLLFVCMEFMQRNEEVSLNYLQQGRCLIQQFVDSRRVTNGQLDLIRQLIVPVYMRSGITAFLLGAHVYPIPLRYDIFHEVPTAFAGIQAARHTFYSILDRIFRTSYVAKQHNSQPEMPPELARKLELAQQELLCALSKWNTAFAIFTATKADGGIPLPSIQLLRMYYHAAIIWVSTSLTSRETDYDKYLEHFAAIVPLARTFLDATQRPMPGPGRGRPDTPAESSAGSTTSTSRRNPYSNNKRDFVFETGAIPLLYFVAVKCRHPLLRKAAVDLLIKHDDRQENLWRSRYIGRVAARVIEIEAETVEQLKRRPTGTPELPIHGPPDEVANLGEDALGAWSSASTRSHPIASNCSDTAKRGTPNSNLSHPLEHTIRDPYAGFTDEYCVSNAEFASQISSLDHTTGADFSLPLDLYMNAVDPDFLNVDPDMYYDGSSSQQNDSASPSNVGADSTPPDAGEGGPSNLSEPGIGFNSGEPQARFPYSQGEMPWSSRRDTHSFLQLPTSGSSLDDTAPQMEIEAPRSMVLEPPYGLPEGSRVVEVIFDPLESGSDGTWVDFFRRDPHGETEMWDEYIYTG